MVKSLGSRVDALHKGGKGGFLALEDVGGVIGVLLGGGPDIGENPDTGVGEQRIYILNISSKKVHRVGCRYETSMSESNRREYEGYLEELIEQGYTACKTCSPE